MAGTLAPPPPLRRASSFRVLGCAGGLPTPGRLGKACTARRAAAPHGAAPSSPGPRRWLSAASAPYSRAVAITAATLASRPRGRGSQAPIAAQRVLAHKHTAAGWPRLGIPGRTDPFPPFFPLSLPQFSRLYNRLRALLAHVLARGRVGGKI